MKLEFQNNVCLQQSDTILCHQRGIHTNSYVGAIKEVRSIPYMLDMRGLHHAQRIGPDAQQCIDLTLSPYYTADPIPLPPTMPSPSCIEEDSRRNIFIDFAIG